MMTKSRYPYGGNYRRMEEQGMLVVVVRLECRYHKPARYDDVLTIRTTVARISAAKIDHEYEVLRDDQRLVEATLTLALVDREGKAQRIPDWLSSD